MMALELGKDVHNKYMSFARLVMSLEKQLYQQWLANSDTAALSYLKLNILTKDEAGSIVVNFSKDLIQLMRETRYLDRMGFEIPEVALNVTLQEESYIKCGTACQKFHK